MKSIIMGIVLVVGGFAAGAPALFHLDMSARGMVAPARSVVAPYHQESSIRAVHTAHGYHVITSTRSR